MKGGAQRVLFVCLSNDGGADRIVAAFGAMGAVCAVLSPHGAYAARSRRVSRHFPLSPLRRGWETPASLARHLGLIVATFTPDVVIPVDEFAATLLRECALDGAAPEAVRTLLTRSLGDPSGYPAACERHALLSRARALGVDVPDFRAVETFSQAREAAAEFGYPVVLKRENTAGSGGVTVARDEAGLAAAFRVARLKAGLKRAVRRLGGRRRPAGPAILVQRFVPGRLAMRTVACHKGMVLAGHSLVSEMLSPALVGSCAIVRPIEDARMDEAAERIVGALGASGFVSFDFMLGDDGSAGLLEMNARPTASGHLAARFGEDIYATYLEWLRGAPVRRVARAWPVSSVALFPKELDRDPSGASLARHDMIHDVPWEDPDLVEVYARVLSRRHPEVAPALRDRLSRPADATGGAARAVPAE